MHEHKRRAIHEHWLEMFSHLRAGIFRNPIVGDVTRWTSHRDDGTEDSFFNLYDLADPYGDGADMKIPVVEWGTYNDETDPYSLEVRLLNEKKAQIATAIVYESYANRAILQFLLDGANAGAPIELHNKQNNPTRMQIVTTPPGTLVNGFRITVHGYYSPVLGGVSFGAPETTGQHGGLRPARDDWRKKGRAARSGS